MRQAINILQRQFSQIGPIRANEQIQPLVADEALKPAHVPAPDRPFSPIEHLGGRLKAIVGIRHLHGHGVARHIKLAPPFPDLDVLKRSENMPTGGHWIAPFEMDFRQEHGSDARKSPVSGKIPLSQVQCRQPSFLGIGEKTFFKIDNANVDMNKELEILGIEIPIVGHGSLAGQSGILQITCLDLRDAKDIVKDSSNERFRFWCGSCQTLKASNIFIRNRPVFINSEKRADQRDLVGQIAIASYAPGDDFVEKPGGLKDAPLFRKDVGQTQLGARTGMDRIRRNMIQEGSEITHSLSYADQYAASTFDISYRPRVIVSRLGVAYSGLEIIGTEEPIGSASM